MARVLLRKNVSMRFDEEVEITLQLLRADFTSGWSREVMVRWATTDASEGTKGLVCLRSSTVCCDL